MPNSIIETPLQGLVGRGTGVQTAAFNPLTGPIDTTTIKDVLFAYWLQSSELTVIMAGQYSNDGLTWTDTPFSFGPSASSTEGWTIDDEYRTQANTPGVRLFIRFGLLAWNTGGVHAPSGLGKMRLTIQGVEHRTERVGLTRVQTPDTKGLYSAFNGLTEWIPTDGFSGVRATWELAALSDADVGGQPAYQQANHPEDYSTWSNNTVYTFGDAATLPGVTYAEEFDTVTFTEQYVRFGIACMGDSSGPEAFLASMRVDLKDL